MAVRLINWLWLEELLVAACESELRHFAAAHPEERVFAFCLEFDGLTGSLDLSYGTREAVEREAAALRADRDTPFCYRAVELRPWHWEHRRVAPRDLGGEWERANAILDLYRESMADEEIEPEAAEFLWLRFEYLAECVVRALHERNVYHVLTREPEFLGYSANENESLEELEDRIERIYPEYRRATQEFADRARTGEVRARYCQGDASHPRTRGSGLARCTACQRWLCAGCRETHQHPDLADRRPFFGAW